MKPARGLPAPAGTAGRTRCPGCDKRFAATPGQPTTTINGTERAGGRPGYSAGGPNGHDRPITIRWHAACLDTFTAQNDAGRRRERQARRDTIEQIARENGLDVDAALAAFDERNPA